MPRHRSTPLALAAASLALLAGFAQARSLDFNRGWRFHLGDAPGAEAPAFDDAGWETVRTPHDWAIAGPFDPQEDGYAAKLPWRGVGWYRKFFSLQGGERGSRVYLDFDGVMAFPKVYVNGHLVGEWDYGYTPFRVDLTPHVRFGRANVVAVRVDTRRLGTRWYPGAGIYRKATLRVLPPTHLAQWGTYVTTPSIDAGSATVRIENTVDNHLDTPQPVEVEVALRSPSGAALGAASRALDPPPHGSATTRVELTIDAPQRWDVLAPNLYTAVTSLKVGGRVVQQRATRFGVRTFEFTADDGFHLNGRRVQLQGVNLHHDLGPLGAAFNRRAAARQLDILMDMGVNAVRTSHNPPCKELLELCDERGLLVWDELFDKFDATAGRIDGRPAFDGHAERHARALALRDRNYPCVVVWSVANEVPNQPYSPEGKSRERVRLLRELIRQHDPTRPVGIGDCFPETAQTDILADLDLTGWNYAERYLPMRRAYPEKPIVYSESASALSTRGYYTGGLASNKVDYDYGAHQVDSMDLNAAPWSDIADAEFALMRRDRYVAGEFVWTGFDYLGEPTPFSREAVSSYFGIVDLCGLPKDRYWLYRSHWRPDVTTVHLAPHWTWPGREGDALPVVVYTNGDSAELFLNGKSLGRRRKGEAPPVPLSLTADAGASASTEAEGHSAAGALQDKSPAWRPASDDGEPWWSVQLGGPRRVRSVLLTFETEAHRCGYRLESRTAGGAWRPVSDHPAQREPQWGGVREVVHLLDVEADALRVVFTPTSKGPRPGLVRFAAYDRPVEAPYYRVTYDYRLRWDNVPYEPGELRVVAYQGAERIGEATRRTAGKPAALRLTADRAGLLNDGEDMAFVRVEAVDAQGNACPTAANEVTLEVEGAGRLAASGNGDPLSHESFASPRRRLFAGAAVAYVLADEGPGGVLQIRASSPGLEAATLRLDAGPAAQ